MYSIAPWVYRAIRQSVVVIVIGTVLSICADNAESADTKSADETTILPLGQVQKDLTSYILKRIPSFTVPGDTTEWNRQAESIRGRLLHDVIYRGVPERWLKAPLRVVRGDTIQAEGYTIRKLRYEAFPGFWIGALLYEPENLTHPVPAVLNVNGHELQKGMFVDYKQARCINEAKRGMLALNTEWLGMGQLGEIGYWHSNTAYLELCGVSGVSVFYQAMKRGLDVLLSHPMADTSRVAVTGLSGGGWQTIMLSSLDTRVKVSVPVAGYIGIRERMKVPRDLGDTEQEPVDMLVTADYVHLTAMLAPRPALLIYNAEDDCCFLAERAVPSVYDPVVPLYRLYGRDLRFQLHINENPGTHNYLKDNREALYRFLNRQFLPREQWIDEELPVDSEILDREKLEIDYPQDNGTFSTLAEEIMRLLPLQKRPEGSSASLTSWRAETRTLLEKVVRPEPKLHVSVEPEPVPAFSETIDGIPGQAFRIRLDESWMLPMAVYEPAKGKIITTTVVLADSGIAGAGGSIRETLKRGERAIAVDLLFIGECTRMSYHYGWFAQAVSCAGGRPIGIQVSQLEAVADYLRSRYPGSRIRVLCDGRVTSLAALTCAALGKGNFESLEIRGMDASLKELVRKNVIYEGAKNMFIFQSPSLFCFGLLELVDIPELIEMAYPVKISCSAK